MDNVEISIKYLNDITGGGTWDVWTRGLNGIGTGLYLITTELPYISNILKMNNIVFNSNLMGVGMRYLVFVNVSDVVGTIRDWKINTILNG